MTDWASFKCEIRFDAESLRNELISIEAHRLSINQLFLPQDWKKDLQKLYIVRAVHGTTAIEGNPLSTVVQALLAHFYFVTLHPFGNGNGRTTRCIEAAILFSGGYNTHGFYSLSNYFYRHRDQYFRMLQEARTRHRYNLTEFIRFGVTGFREELERINSYIRNRTHRLQYRELIRRCSFLQDRSERAVPGLQPAGSFRGHRTILRPA